MLKNQVFSWEMHSLNNNVLNNKTVFTITIIEKHIRQTMEVAFHLKKKAAKATEMICAAYEENAVSYLTFKNGINGKRQVGFGLKDEPRAGRPQNIDTDEL